MYTHNNHRGDLEHRLREQQAVKRGFYKGHIYFLAFLPEKCRGLFLVIDYIFGFQTGSS